MLQHDTTNNKHYFYGKEITAERYDEILSVIKKMPKAEEGHFYILTENLEWELQKAPESEPTDADKAEAYDILMGVSE